MYDTCVKCFDATGIGDLVRILRSSAVRKDFASVPLGAADNSTLEESLREESIYYSQYCLRKLRWCWFPRSSPDLAPRWDEMGLDGRSR